MYDSALVEQTLAALGATARAMPVGGDLDGYDAVELNLASVKGFGYASVVDSIAANVDLWPRPQVLLISQARFDQLSPEEQQILRAATNSMRAESLEDLGAEDQKALSVLCKTDVSFPVAKAADLRALEAAVGSVHQGLRADPDTPRWVNEIAGLKSAVAAPPEVASCDKAKQSSQAAGIPDGTYTRTITQADLDKLGIPGKTDDGDYYPLGTWTLAFDNGLMTMRNANPQDED
jgi:Bacterial extracellular solute-binding protein, family 7